MQKQQKFALKGQIIMSKFLSKRLEALKEYVPGEQPKDKKYTKLNTNESPFPPSPQAIEVINDEEINNLRLYSDPQCTELAKAFSDVYSIDNKNIIFGNGSDEILSFAFTAFCDKTTPAVFPDISYGFYSVFANLNCIDFKKIPLKDDFTIDPEDYKNAGGTIFIANPNAPTGLLLTLDQIKYILDTNRQNVVIIDEAYVDFGGESAIGLTKEYDNLLIVQTFSKSRSLAGARLGFGIASEEIISDLQRIRNSNNPYNVNRLTQKLGAASLRDTDYFKKCTSTIIENRAYLTEELRYRGFKVIDSKSNFVFASHPLFSGEEIYLGLKNDGVLVRYFDSARIKEFVRITIGSMSELNKLLESIDKIIK